MTDNPDIRRTKLVSLAFDNPAVGVNLTKPAWQNVYLNGPVKEWVVTKVGENRYRLGVGGYPYTGVLEDKVIASIHPHHDVEWIFNHAERQDGFSIALAKSPAVGWTISEHKQILVSTLFMGPSDPPVYPTGQLFQFQPNE